MGEQREGTNLSLHTIHKTVKKYFQIDLRRYFSAKIIAPPMTIRVKRLRQTNMSKCRNTKGHFFFETPCRYTLYILIRIVLYRYIQYCRQGAYWMLSPLTIWGNWSAVLGQWGIWGYHMNILWIVQMHQWQQKWHELYKTGSLGQTPD